MKKNATDSGDKAGDIVWVGFGGGGPVMVA